MEDSCNACKMTPSSCLPPPSLTPLSRTTHPLVLWAQRNDTILLTVSVNDITNEKYKVNEKSFSFYGEGGEGLEKYHCELEFHKEIVPQVRKRAWE